MPNRIIKETINESRGLTCCTFFAQDLYKRLITYSDDYGRFNADPQIMLARLYPRELAIVSLDDAINALIDLAGVGKIAFYTAAPRREIYGCFPNWAEHQRMRESKRRFPEPTDTTINDWYLRRFIPFDMKVSIVQRDGYKCQLCGKHIAACDNPDRFVKMGYGLFHLDHIVPCNQGGRATLENLRLTCPKCNQSRKKAYSFDEIVQFAASGGDSRQSAETSGLNPIQSESNSESESNSNARSRADVWFDEFWSAYPKKVGKGAAQKAYAKIKIAEELHQRMLTAIAIASETEQWRKDGGQFIPNPATWLNQQRWDDEPTSLVQSPPQTGHIYDNWLDRSG